MADMVFSGVTFSGGFTVELPPSGNAPVNTVAPVVSGTASFGSTLSTTNGTWTGSTPITYTYQWQRGSGSSFSNITNATNSTYTLVRADVNVTVRCVVTATNSGGSTSANSNATVDISPIAPGAPTIGTATATGSTTATVAFTAPASDGGATITSYTATSTPGNITGTLFQAGSGTINMTGLTASTSYTFTVTATNGLETSNASAASNSITTSSPATVPGAPRFVGASVDSATSALVSFTAPASDGGATITSYTATSTPGNITGTVNQSGGGTIIVTGLTTGTSYTFTVTATNSVGTGSASSPAAGPVIPAATTKMFTTGGTNASYELGDQTSYQRSSPVLVNGGVITWASGVVFTDALYPPQGQGLGIDSSGILYSWGLGRYGSSGLGPSTGSEFGYTQLTSIPEYVYYSLWSNATTALDVSMGVTTAGRLFGWGRNDYKTSGCLGLDSLGDYFNPGLSSTTQVGSLTNWSKVSTNGSTSFAIKTDGTLWSMGNNYRGQLGLNDSSGSYYSGRSSPTQVGTDTDWSKVVGDQESTIGLRTNGTLWGWGADQYGTLGQNTVYNFSSSPVQIGTDTNWADVDIGNGSVIALRTNGTLWGWGNNRFGVVGDGTRNHRSSPTQIGTATNWAKASVSLGDMSWIADPSVGGGSVIARKTTGTAWSWGNNAHGELGLGDTISRSSPVQIGSSTNWSNSGKGILMLTS